MVPLLIMATSLVSKINTSVALLKGWVNSFLAFMGQVYLGFYNGQTLPLLPVRINRSAPHVMVLLPSGRRHMVPRAATNLEHPGEAVASASPLPSISVRTILPLARLVQQLKQAKEESHAEQTASTIHPTESCVPSSRDDLLSASPEPPAATRASSRQAHSARVYGQTKQGGHS